jgi:hypothetical protein
MKIRCKFMVQAVYRPEGSDGIVVQANAVWDNSPENREFSKATPWGTLNIGIDNPDVLPAFLDGGPLVAGRYFFLDLTPA